MILSIFLMSLFLKYKLDNLYNNNFLKFIESLLLIFP